MEPHKIAVVNLNQLYAIQNHEEGEIAYVSDTQELYSWSSEHGWSKIVATDNNFDLGLSLYDLNKSIIGQLDPMTPGEITMKLGLIDEYYQKTNNAYHMLLCRDFNYYTIFNYDSMLSIPNFSTAVCSIITELGEVYSIELNTDSAMEIWIKPNGKDTLYAFYLFPYDAGVVYYG